MNSPFANLFLAIQQRIADQVTAITFIDQDLGQLSTGTTPAVSWPCVLIDIEDFKFSVLGENAQLSEGVISLKLGFTTTSSSEEATPLTYRQNAIAFYDIEWNLHKALQGWSPGDEYGYLSRIHAFTEHRKDAIRLRHISYHIAFEDYSTANTETLVVATIEPQLQFITA